MFHATPSNSHYHHGFTLIINVRLSPGAFVRFFPLPSEYVIVHEIQMFFGEKKNKRNIIHGRKKRRVNFRILTKIRDVPRRARLISITFERTQTNCNHNHREIISNSNYALAPPRWESRSASTPPRDSIRRSGRYVPGARRGILNAKLIKIYLRLIIARTGKQTRISATIFAVL